MPIGRSRHRTGGPLSDLPAPVAARLKPPGWLDGRLIAGVLLVLLSVVIGAKVVASSDRYDVVWAASRDVAAGTTLTKADLEQAQVRFRDHGKGYFGTSGGSLVGRTTTQPLAAGQLIPVAAVPAAAPSPTRLVTLPVAKLHMPRGGDLQGEQVDVYVTPKATAGQPQPAPQLVLANVTIADTINDSSALGGSGGSGVVLSVPMTYVDAVVAAAESGSIDLVKIPGALASGTPSPGTFALAGPTASASP